MAFITSTTKNLTTLIANRKSFSLESNLSEIYKGQSVIITLKTKYVSNRNVPYTITGANSSDFVGDIPLKGNFELVGGTASLTLSLKSETLTTFPGTITIALDEEDPSISFNVLVSSGSGSGGSGSGGSGSGGSGSGGSGSGGSGSGGSTGTDSAVDSTGTDSAVDSTGTDSAVDSTGTDSAVDSTGTDSAVDSAYAPQAVYSSLESSVETLDEGGNSVTFTLIGQNMLHGPLSGTWNIVPVPDLQLDGELSGNFSITDNTESFVVTKTSLDNQSSWEDVEVTFNVNIDGNTLSKTITLKDNDPSYNSVTTDKVIANEGDTISLKLNGKHMGRGANGSATGQWQATFTNCSGTPSSGNFNIPQLLNSPQNSESLINLADITITNDSVFTGGNYFYSPDYYPPARNISFTVTVMDPNLPAPSYVVFGNSQNSLISVDVQEDDNPPLPSYSNVYPTNASAESGDPEVFRMSGSNMLNGSNSGSYVISGVGSGSGTFSIDSDSDIWIANTSSSGEGTITCTVTIPTYDSEGNFISNTVITGSAFHPDPPPPDDGE